MSLRSVAQRERDIGLGGIIDHAANEIDGLREALAIAKAERDHWHALVPLDERIRFPFKMPLAK